MKKVTGKITLLIGPKRNTASNPFKTEGYALKLYSGGWREEASCRDNYTYALLPGRAAGSVQLWRLRYNKLPSR